MRGGRGKEKRNISRPPRTATHLTHGDENSDRPHARSASVGRHITGEFIAILPDIGFTQIVRRRKGPSGVSITAEAEPVVFFSK